MLDSGPLFGGVVCSPQDATQLFVPRGDRILLDGSTLTLEVNGLVQNVATGCREAAGRIGLQSEGAWIEFRKVELREVLPSK